MVLYRVLIGIVVYGFIVAINSQECPDPNPPYTCDPNNNKSVTIYNSTLLCPEDQVCNARNKEPCSMCIPDVRNCDGNFKCDDTDDTLVEIGGIFLSCTENYVCNKDFEDPCTPCVLGKCDDGSLDNLECSSDLSSAIVDNVVYPCDNGFVCNQEKIQPCTYCVEPEGSSSSGPNVTTTSAPGTTTPNCNDGTNILCRPKDSISYYKCVAVWTWYEARETDCSNLSDDSVCRNTASLCV